MAGLNARCNPSHPWTWAFTDSEGSIPLKSPFQFRWKFPLAAPTVFTPAAAWQGFQGRVSGSPAFPCRNNLSRWSALAFWYANPTAFMGVSPSFMNLDASWLTLSLMSLNIGNSATSVMALSTEPYGYSSTSVGRLPWACPVPQEHDNIPLQDSLSHFWLSSSVPDFWLFPGCWLCNVSRVPTNPTLIEWLHGPSSVEPQHDLSKNRTSVRSSEGVVLVLSSLVTWRILSTFLALGVLYFVWHKNLLGLVWFRG